MTTQSQTPINKITSNGEQAILEAAEILFADKGFDAVSVSAIAKQAKTSKANIYHHFKSKNALYLAVIKTAIQRSSVLLDTLEDAPGTFGQHLSGFSTGQLENILSHQRSTKLILREALTGDSERGQEIAKHIVGKVFTRLVAMVSQGQQEKEFRADIDPALAAFMVVASNMFFFQAAPVLPHIPETQFTNDTGVFSQGVMDILFNGINRQGADRS